MVCGTGNKNRQCANRVCGALVGSCYQAKGRCNGASWLHLIKLCMLYLLVLSKYSYLV